MMVLLIIMVRSVDLGLGVLFLFLIVKKELGMFC